MDTQFLQICFKEFRYKMPKKIKYDKMSIFSDFTSIPEDKLKIKVSVL